MPSFGYTFTAPGAGCAAGPGAPLVAAPSPILLGYPQLLNAQLRLGIYPGGWVVDELTWRTICLVISCAPLAAAGGVPGAAPPAGVAPGVPVAGALAGLIPASPVAAGVDATERGQLGYHMGTGVGGSLGEYLAAPAGALWFPFHLSRAQANGGIFGFANAQRPDIVTFAVTPPGAGPPGGPGGPVPWVHFYVVWENKGHCVNFGGAMAIAPALAQAQSLVNMTSIPGNPALGVVGGTACAPTPPACYVASQVDLTGVGGNFRVRTIDPSFPPRPPLLLSTKDASDFFRAYYAPYVEAVQKGPSQRRVQYGKSWFRTIELPKEVRFGLDEEIFKAITSHRSDLAFAIGQVLAGGYRFPPNTVHVHETGISVEVPPNWYPWPEAARTVT